MSVVDIMAKEPKVENYTFSGVGLDARALVYDPIYKMLLGFPPYNNPGHQRRRLMVADQEYVALHSADNRSW